jgi:formylglycine-generating enzyme required for sulfatase activity
MRKLALVVVSLVGFGCSRPAEHRPDKDAVVIPVAQAPQAAAPQVAASAAAPAPKAGSDRCPANMILVEGMYCTNMKQECADWIEDPAKNPYARCARFKEPSECVGQRVPVSFCVDRNEYAKPGDDLPTGDISWTDAKKTCESDGKRLCQEAEWTFACEGEQGVPYPYGYKRDPSACNFDHTDVVEDYKFKDMRQSVDSNPRCVSPTGVHNLVGNIDEWVILDKPHYSEKNGGRKMMSGLKGGWWGPLRNRCRPVTVDHDEYFHELQTGFRCCADPKAKVAQAETE